MRVWTFLGLIAIYLYLYLAPILNWFYPTPTRMRSAWYANYFRFINRISLAMGLPIQVSGAALDRTIWGLIIANHSSVIDNLVLAHVFQQHNIEWNDVRTVSRISGKRWQNRILALFDSLLVTKDTRHDIAAWKRVRPKWEAAGPLQVVLYPEGGVYGRESRLTAEQTGYLGKLGLPRYTNVLFPRNGLFEMLLANMAFQVYDFTISYCLNGRRLTGEREILWHLADPDLVIQVGVNRYTKAEAEAPDWLYRTWAAKDAAVLRY